MSGSLSQMAYAGVSDEDINAFIARNQSHQEVLGDLFTTTEQQVREDMNEIRPTRDDQDAIPVICMGFYGGWSYDNVELCEQQQKILDTYNQQDKFVIVGFYPDAAIDTAAYDQILRDTWGDHYLNMSEAIDEVAYSEAGHEQMAKALFDKLLMLGYVK